MVKGANHMKIAFIKFFNISLTVSGSPLRKRETASESKAIANMESR